MSDVDGTDIIGGLLRLDAAVVALVPVERIKGGALPENVPLPALLVRLGSNVEHQTLTRGRTVRQTDRVRVTARATSWREAKAAIAAARRCCAGVIGDLQGGRRVAILSAGIGPDLRGPGDSFERTHDFRVSYDADA